jgi:predicted nucleic acid-binding protein
MRQCLLDSGPMVAVFNRSDRYFEASATFFKEYKGELLTTLANITEVVYLLDRNPKAQQAFLEWIGRGVVTIAEITPVEIAKIGAYFEKYVDLPMDFADGCLVMLAERTGILRVATVDSDFYVYRTESNLSFEVLVR